MKPSGLRLNDITQKLFLGFSLICLISFIGAISLKLPAMALIPAGVLVGLQLLVNPKVVYALLFLCIPISIEWRFSSSLGMELPTEPLMIIMLLTGIVLLISRVGRPELLFFRHPLSWILLLHVLWIGLCILPSINPMVSTKFFLAKLWFIVPFYMLAFIFFKREGDFERLFTPFLFLLSLVTLVILVHHAVYGFDFTKANRSVFPFFRNHVNYAALLTIMLPFIWYYYRYASRQRKKRFIWIALILVAGISFSYTRGAWLALIVGVVSYFIIRWNMMKPLLIIGLVSAVAGVFYLVNNNKYLDFAPEYDNTIYHENFSDHFEATFNMKDVSGAERIYRYVAAFHMSLEHPLFGFGPGNFYPNYKKYTVPAFRTYVSENKEKSTVHNYFLLMLVEQGFPGLIIYIGVIILFYLYVQRLYLRLPDKKGKRWILCLGVCMTILLVQNSLSDLIESGKIGPFYFLLMALLVATDLKHRKLEGNLP